MNVKQKLFELGYIAGIEGIDYSYLGIYREYWWRFLFMQFGMVLYLQRHIWFFVVHVN